MVVEYEVTDALAAVEPGAPCLYDDLPNIMIDAEVGDAKATEEAFAGAAHVTRLDTWINRVTGVPMEPRAAVGSYDAGSGRFTLYAGSGGIVRQKKELAVHMLETAEDDIVFTAGRFTVKGTDRSVGIFEVAKAADGKIVPRDLAGSLAASCDEAIKQLGFPYGAHVCEVEIDPHTGGLDLVRYTAVDDVGRAINPMVVDGQTHGGAAQGIGQALCELCAYDKQGQLLSASLMDYALPRADMLPSFTTDISEVLTPTNRLGVRGAGEGGTTGALGAVVNAVVDALAEFGVTHIEMPVTPERVWRAIQSAKGRRSLEKNA